jgi:hypothetical protein
MSENQVINGIVANSRIYITDKIIGETSFETLRKCYPINTKMPL